MPFGIVSGTVGSLEVQVPMSVQGVLDDGASLTASNVHFHLRLSDLVSADVAPDALLEDLVGAMHEHAAAASASTRGGDRGEGGVFVDDGEDAGGRAGEAERQLSRGRMDASVSSATSLVLSDVDEDLLFDGGSSSVQAAPEGMTLVEVALKRVFANIEGTFTAVELRLDCGGGRSLVLQVNRLGVKDTTASHAEPSAEADFDQASVAERTRQIRVSGLRLIACGFGGADSSHGGAAPRSFAERGGSPAAASDDVIDPAESRVLLRSLTDDDGLVSLVTRERPSAGVPGVAVDVSLRDVVVTLQPTDFGVLMEVVDRCVPAKGAYSDGSGSGGGADELLMEVSVQVKTPSPPPSRAHHTHPFTPFFFSSLTCAHAHTKILCLFCARSLSTHTCLCGGVDPQATSVLATLFLDDDIDVVARGLSESSQSHDNAGYVGGLDRVCVALNHPQV
jgi:hypothetical protein